MFCPNCGNQNPDNAACCGFCGAKLPNQNSNNMSSGPVTDMNGVIANFQNKTAMFLAIIAGIALLALIFWFTETVNGSLMGESETTTLADAAKWTDVKGLCTFLTVLAVLSSLATIAYAALLFMKRTFVNSVINPVPFCVTGGVGILSLIIGYIALAAEYDGYVDIGPSFTGILYILLCVAIIVIPVLLNKKIIK